MRNYLKKFICLVVLLASTVHCQVNGKKPSADTQKTTEVTLSGTTVVTVSSAKCNIRVIIKTHKVEKKIDETWDAKLSPVPASCKQSSWCSLVDKIDIIVNGKQVRIPQALVSKLAVLATAEVRMDEGGMMLLLEEGDASEADFVKIEFDYNRVTKMSLFADDSMDRNLLLHEETYP